MLRKAIKLDPENHIFYSNRAAAYMAMEKFERALRDANECVRLQPTWAKGYSRQAAAFLSMGDLQAARDACMRGFDPLSWAESGLSVWLPSRGLLVAA